MKKEPKIKPLNTGIANCQWSNVWSILFLCTHRCAFDKQNHEIYQTFNKSYFYNIFVSSMQKKF